MPIYEFKCQKCGKVIETLCKVGDTGSELTCPDCGEQRMQRQLSCFNSGSVPSGKSCRPGCGGNCSSCH